MTIEYLHAFLSIGLDNTGRIARHVYIGPSFATAVRILGYFLSLASFWNSETIIGIRLYMY